MEYRYERYGNLSVAWTPDLDGGGRSFGQQTIALVRTLFGKVDRAYEFCAGPGFIGFSMLAAGLCDSLCLSDINPTAVEAVERTIALNGLADRVTIYESDCLDGIPELEQWDLVVSNPPHFNASRDGVMGLRACDPGWDIHRRFYAHVRRHLKANGQCLMQENYTGSSEATFTALLERTGLEYAGSLVATDPHMPSRFPNTFYFFWTRVRPSMSLTCATF